MVIDTQHGGRGVPNTVTYEYMAEGRYYVGHIIGSNFYESGEQVTVYVDPDDLTSSTLKDEHPQSAPAFWLMIALLSVSFMFVVMAVVLTWRRWKAKRA